MKPINPKKIQFRVKDIAVIGMMAALLEAVKLSLMAIPNVELVSLLIIIFTLCLGPKALFGVWAFVGVECVIWGVGLWTIMYIYIWPILVLCTYLLRKNTSKWPFVVLSTLYGFSFGALCAIPYLFITGPIGALTWWINGIPYDLAHGIANGIIAACLYHPLLKAARRSLAAIDF